MLRNKMKNFVPQILVRGWLNIKKNWMDGYARKSYSQEGEDLVLMRLLEGKSLGFYVDVGAHHPRRFSNTFFFYKKGWSGINIDAMPGSMTVFNAQRSRDINIEIPISDREEVLTYYEFNEPALNGFSKEISASRDGLNSYKIIGTRSIRTQTLDCVLESNLPFDQQIDFLTIDVEGLDFKVLRSIDLKKYKPSFIVIEVLDFSFSGFTSSEIYCYLSQKGYYFVSKCVNSIIFKRE